MLLNGRLVYSRDSYSSFTSVSFHSIRTKLLAQKRVVFVTIVLMLYYNKSIAHALQEMKTSENGLSTTDAEERLRIYGPNAIRIKGQSFWRKLIEPFLSVFMGVLFLAAVVSLLHGDLLDAVIILIIIAVSACIYYVQRFSTERVLRSLQKHTRQDVDVLRDGIIVSVDSSMLVPGDVFILNEGDKVPADGRLIASENTRVDEAQLTGESVPVKKILDQITGQKEVYEQTNMLFQGSFIVAGTATAVVVATGNESEFGQLASLSSETIIKSPVQEKIDKLLTHVIAAVGGLAMVAFGLAIFRGNELTDAISFVLALSVSAVPESLPVAISVVLILGMRRMAVKKALVRNMRAIETIGVITTIATDKTGTLTQNKLTVQETWQPISVKTHIGTVAHFSANQGGHISHDPLDIAMIEFAQAEQIVIPKGTPLTSLPFDQDVSMSGNIWHHGTKFHLNIKGAPEQILSRSTLSKSDKVLAEEVLIKFTAQGYRVIAVATTVLEAPIKSFLDLPSKVKLDFVGFLAIADILRPEAKRAISAALGAGVTVRMITGDHFETAYHIGKKLGMVENRDQVFDSRRMHTMGDQELSKVIEDVRVFSRVIPEDKYRILALLKQKNITAMTGDGVNDVPALVNAHVGIAMGSGSQIAKDAGDIILLDNNFKSIVDAMREGRTIFANIRRMLVYLLATNTGLALTMVGALVIGLPIPLLPVQILWINLVTDSSMVIPLGLEKGEKNSMKQKPRLANASILDPYMISRIILVALSMAALSLILYIIFDNLYGHEYARTIVFCALVVIQWSNAFNARSDYESIFKRLRVFSRPFYIGLTIAISLQLLAIFGPLQELLHIHTVALGDLVITGLIAFFLPIILVEIHKYIGRRLYT